MTEITERLAQLRLHLEHLRALRPRVTGSEALARDLSLHNDVLFSLLLVCQLAIDIAGELSTRRGLTFGDYTEAIGNLRHDARFDEALVTELERLPGFRNVLVHRYVILDLERVVAAVERIQPVEEFVRIVAGIVASEIA
jgi:uncharacterized protein YutE (UPF0331/DUF86 family)